MQCKFNMLNNNLLKEIFYYLEPNDQFMISLSISKKLKKVFDFSNYTLKVYRRLELEKYFSDLVLVFNEEISNSPKGQKNYFLKFILQAFCLYIDQYHSKNNKARIRLVIEDTCLGSYIYELLSNVNKYKTVYTICNLSKCNDLKIFDHIQYLSGDFLKISDFEFLIRNNISVYFEDLFITNEHYDIINKYFKIYPHHLLNFSFFSWDDKLIEIIKFNIKTVQFTNRYRLNGKSDLIQHLAKYDRLNDFEFYLNYESLEKVSTLCNYYKLKVDLQSCIINNRVLKLTNLREIRSMNVTNTNANFCRNLIKLNKNTLELIEMNFFSEEISNDLALFFLQSIKISNLHKIYINADKSILEKTLIDPSIFFNCKNLVFLSLLNNKNSVNQIYYKINCFEINFEFNFNENWLNMISQMIDRNGQNYIEVYHYLPCSCISLQNIFDYFYFSDNKKKISFISLNTLIHPKFNTSFNIYEDIKELEIHSNHNNLNLFANSKYPGLFSIDKLVLKNGVYINPQLIKILIDRNIRELIIDDLEYLYMLSQQIDKLKLLQTITFETKINNDEKIYKLIEKIVENDNIKQFRIWAFDKINEKKFCLEMFSNKFEKIKKLKFV